MSILARAHRTLIDLFDPVQQGSAPSAPVTGMLWLDTGVTPNQLMRWNGAAWVTVNDTAGILSRLNAAESKITDTAIVNTVRANALYQGDLGAKNKTFVGTAAPTATAQGDLWIDTESSNLLKRWNGAAWVALQDGAISVAQQTADKINWIIASGTEASNMTLTDKLYELVTNRVMITAQESINLSISGIQLGGRNLLTGTSEEYQDCSLGQYNGEIVIDIIPSDIGLKGGDEITVCAYLDPAGTRDLRIQIVFQPGAGSINGNTISAASEGYSQATGVVPAGTTSFSIYIQNMTQNAGITAEQYKELHLVKGNKSAGWSPAPEDPAYQANSVIDTGISLSKEGLAMSGPKIDFETDEFLVSSLNADRVMMSLTEEGLLVDADVLECPNIVGNVLNTFTDAAVEFAGTIQGTIDNLPKYLTQETTITVPAGTYNEDIEIIGVIGQKLYLFFEPGVVINGKILISGCSTVHLHAETRGDCKIYSNDSTVLRIYYGNAYIQSLYFFGGAATNYGIAADFAKLCVVGCGFKGMSNYCVMYRFGSNGWCYNNYGSSNGGYAIRAEQGSDVKVNGVVPTTSSGMTSASFSIIDTFGTVSTSSGTTTTIPATDAVTHKSTAALRMAEVEQRTGTSLYGGSISWSAWGTIAYADWAATKPRQGILEYAKQQTHAGMVATTYKQRRDKYYGVWLFNSFAVAGKTIQTAKITIKRSASVGAASAVYLQLYRHAYTSAPTYHSVSMTDTGQQISLKPGEKKTLTLSAAQVSLLNSGAAKGYGLSSGGYLLSAEVSASIEMTYA